MKKVIVFAAVLAMIFTSCHNYKKDAERLSVLSDSLRNENSVRESAIVEFLNDYNEIQANLDSIKSFEKLVTVQSNTGRELNANQKQRILEDINLLNDLLQKNKAMVANLQKKLSNSNFKIGQLEGMIAELNKMVNGLQAQVLEKDNEIAALNQEVRNLNINIGNLNQKITEIETVSAQKTETITAQTNQMNTAWYVMGTMKELKDNGIVEKEGGVIGIGRTKIIRKDFNRDYFTKIDIRNFDYLPLLVKKATVVSVHPQSSFHISGKKRSADTLYIDNREEFWNSTKYLVIVVD
jgi:DNA repair exonuclease SbcCD ATPase subunit